MSGLGKPLPQVEPDQAGAGIQEMDQGEAGRPGGPLGPVRGFGRRLSRARAWPVRARRLQSTDTRGRWPPAGFWPRRRTGRDVSAAGHSPAPQCQPSCSRVGPAPTPGVIHRHPASAGKQQPTRTRAETEPSSEEGHLSHDGQSHVTSEAQPRTGSRQAARDSPAGGPRTPAGTIPD